MSGLARHTTPPPAVGRTNGGLPTPPSTGQSTKRVRFNIPQGGRKRLRYDQDEVCLAEYTEVNDDEEYEASYPRHDSDSDRASNPQASTTPASTPPTTPNYKDTKPNPLYVPAFPPRPVDFDQPFPFMNLPITIRKRIYENLLVIPAIICVRQNHTAYHEEKKAFLYQESRALLPGIAYALAQTTVDGHKFRYSNFRSATTIMLRTNRAIYNESKPILYGKNRFEIVMPSLELSPPIDFSIPLFSRHVQSFVHHIVIRIRAFYPTQWLLNGGFAELRTAYRGLETLTLVLEIETADRGLSKRFKKADGEKWVPYVKRLHGLMAVDISGGGGAKFVRSIPTWIDLRVLFDGDRYDEMSDPVDQDPVHSTANDGLSLSGGDTAEEEEKEEVARTDMKRGLPEAFELFKKGSRAHLSGAGK